MKSFLLCIAFCLTIVGAASAQPITTERGKKSDEIVVKLRKIDLLNQILPLLLTKEQINRILPLIEQARAKQKLILSQEDDELAKLQPQIEETYAKAVEKNEYPTKEFSSMIAAKTKAMSMKRSIALIEMVEVVQDNLLKILNEGQRKALIGSFDARFIDPTKKPEEISEGTRTRFYVERVLLDPLTRELLIEIVDKKKE
ncbi:MAG: hypothetical protein ACAH95_02245 [Fimbriimonas sp.]